MKRLHIRKPVVPIPTPQDVVRKLFGRTTMAFLGAVCLVGCSGREKPTGVYCPDPVWDFGTVDPVAVPEVKHSFRIENPTSEPVRIKTTTSCGCMVLDGAPQTIPANSGVDLPITTNVAGTPGPFQKMALVEVASDPPVMLKLVVEGHLQATDELFSIPGTVDFGTLTGAEEKQRIVRVACYDGSPLKIDRVECEQAGIKAVVSDVSDSTAVQVVVSADAALVVPGDHTTILRVFPIGSSTSPFDIPCRVRAGAKPKSIRVVED